jgi:hypothetical protein
MHDRGRRPPPQQQRGGTGGPRRPLTRRPISPRSPLEGRQLWRIGDWGGASEQIGRRWEQLGGRSLDGLIGVERAGPDDVPYLPKRAIVIANDPALAAQVQAHGKSHADAILVGVQGDRGVLEPVDFKWTLETANPRQVGAEVLADLLTDPPALLAERLRDALANVPTPDDPALHDGIFLAPDHAANRAILAPSGPLDPAWVALCPVDAAEFFTDLAGWDVALALARADGIQLRGVETTERYYRLGAGVLGALRRLNSSVFDEGLPDVDGPTLLTQLRRERRLITTGEVIAYFDRALTARSEVVSRLRDVERAAYPFGQFRQDLAQRGGSEGDNPRSSRTYGSIMKTLTQELRAEGRRLRAEGHSDLAILDELDAQRARWLARGRRLLAARLSPGLP